MAEYTVDIPGMTDIFRTPIHEGYPTLKQIKEAGGTREDYLREVPEHIRQLRKQRGVRMATAQSPLPNLLQKIPAIINHIDDAQDLLFTGLVLAKPLLRRLPSRFIPYLGWVLLANDVMNLMTWILATPLTGGGAKAAARALLRKKLKGKRAKLGRIPSFLGRTPWLPFVLQAGQAVESLTGYGLRLGAVLGMATDTVWGTYRHAMGDRVIVRNPPPADPVSKAYRFISQIPWQAHYQNILTPYEEAIIIAANNVAMQIIQDAGEVSRVDERNDEVARAKPLIYEPWNEESIEGLQEAGLPTRGEDIEHVSMLPMDADFVDVVRASAELEPEWQAHRKEQYRACDGGTILQQIHSEAGEISFELLTGERDVVQDDPHPYEIIIMRAIEWGQLPHSPFIPRQDRYRPQGQLPPPLAPSINNIPQDFINKTNAWLEAVYNRMTQEGREAPTVYILNQEGTRIFGRDNF